MLFFLTVTYRNGPRFNLCLPSILPKKLQQQTDIPAEGETGARGAVKISQSMRRFLCCGAAITLIPCVRPPENT